MPIYTPFQRANMPGSPYAQMGAGSLYQSIGGQTQPVGVFVTPNNQQQQQQQQAVTPLPPGANPMRLALAKQMLATGSSTAPVMSPLEGLARALQGGIGGYMAGQETRADTARQTALGERMAGLAGLDPELAKGLSPEQVLQVGALQAQQLKAATPKTFTAVNYHDPDDPTRIVTVQTPQEQAAAIQAGLIKGSPPSGWSVETLPDGTTRVSMGRTTDKGPLTSSTASKTEQAVMGAEDNLARIEYLEEMFDPSYLEYGGKGKALTETILNKMGLSEGEFAAERAAYQQTADQLFNDYRVAVTGAGAGPTELKMLARSFPTMNDAPAVYKAKLRWLKDWNEYIAQRGRAALDQGVAPQSRDFKEFANEYEKENPPPPARPETVEAGAGPTAGAEGGGEAPGIMLTREEIEAMTPAQLEKVDPSIIPPDLLPLATKRLRGAQDG